MLSEASTVPISNLFMYRISEREDVTIYGIVDPRIQKFVYVGFTSDFAERQRAYLDPETVSGASRTPSGAIVRWTHRAVAEGLVPVFIVLQILDVRSAALLSKATWVRRLISADHPLLNGESGYSSSRRASYAGRPKPKRCNSSRINESQCRTGLDVPS